jgi:hypothetical protein
MRRVRAYTRTVSSEEARLGGPTAGETVEVVAGDDRRYSLRRR